tara:strand:+ start:315 stop:449 length:135 start_codon:yes stop_codon:yes gene_type:complete
MSHQSDKMKASVTSFSPEVHHNKPEEHKEDEDSPQSLEETLLGD